MVGDVAGAQLWIALPEEARHGAAGFQHLAELPVADLPNGEASVLIGSLAGVASPADAHTLLVAADVTFEGSTVLPADRSFEYGVVPLDRPLKVHDAVVEPGSISLVLPGSDDLPIEAAGGRSRALVIGGEPLGEKIQMWWNFVARSKEEITEAWRAWQAHDTNRFGEVPTELPRIDAPRPMWVPSE